MGSEAVSGVLNLDKPSGWTSHDVVARVRRLAGIRRVGHAGTLDPMATGVLVICLGRATRLVEYLMGQPKSYKAEITLGTATDTYDATGRTVLSNPVPELQVDDIQASLALFQGEILQTPPVYSAIKQDGVPLYKRARRGQAVFPEARRVTIYELQFLSYRNGILWIEMTCSAGTYVRSIAHDLGEKLGCGAHLSQLRRLAVGDFTIEEAIAVNQLAASDWLSHLMPARRAVSHLAQITLTDREVQKVMHGQSIPSSSRLQEPEQNTEIADPRRALDSTGQLVAIVRFDQDQESWKPVKVLL